MDRPLLNDFQDRLLALAEDDWVHFKLARPVMGTYYERNVSFRELSAAVGRLSRLGLLRWRIRHNGRIYFRVSAPEDLQHGSAAAFQTSAAGKAYLAEPRHVS